MEGRITFEAEDVRGGYIREKKMYQHFLKFQK